MNGIREVRTSERSGTDSDDEGSAALKQILKTRQKAVPKRRLTPHQQNGETSMSTDNQMTHHKQESRISKRALDAGRLWSETAMIQSLEDKIGSGSIADMHDRGSETYALDNSRKRRRNDDISDSIWDAQEPMREEELPPKSPEYLLSNGAVAPKVEMKDEDQSTAVVDPVADLWEGVDTGAVELPIQRNKHKGNQSKWKRFKRDHSQRNRNFKSQKKFHSKTENKEKKLKEQIPAANFVPYKLMTSNFDREKLFKAEFDPETLSEEQLVAGLVDALGEKNPEVISKAVKYAGKSLSVELFKKCQEKEKEGGMLTDREHRRRTPGGVFLNFLKMSNDVSEEHKKDLFTYGQNKHSKARYEKKKQRKWIKGEKAPPPIEKELPKSSELLKPEDIPIDCNSESVNGDIDDLVLELPIPKSESNAL